MSVSHGPPHFSALSLLFLTHYFPDVHPRSTQTKTASGKPAMSDPAAVAAPSPNPNPAPSPPPPPRLREEGELSSGADDDEALGTNLTFASNVGKSSEVVQVPSTTFSGKGTSGLSLPNVRPHKSAAPSYRKNLRMKQVQFKVSTKRSRCWQKPVSSDNLVISFSDDDSGSDSGKSKREDSRDRGGSSQDASKMASNMQTKMVREETPQQMTQVAKLGYANCSTIPLTLGNSGASRGSGATMSRREPSIRHSTPVKAPSSQKDRNSEDVNSAVSNLRHEIAIRENELRVQKRSTSLGFAKDADLSTYRSRSPIEKLSSETPNSGGCSPLNGSLGPDSRSTKRLKPEQQCSNNQVPGGHLAALVPTNISMGKNNVQFTERRACFENGGNMNCNISGTELSNQIEHNAATRNLPASETHHRVTQDTGRRAAVEYSDKFAAVEYNGKHSIAEDSSTLVPVTLVQAVPDVGTSSKKVMDGMFSACDRQQNTDLLNCSGQMGTGEGRTTLLSLLEMEELQEKDLEEAQEHRRRCEVEEKEALRAYRKAQRALIEANERCAILRRKRELFSARLHGFIAENPSSAWPSSIPNAGVTHVMPSVPNSEVPADCQMPENLGGNSNIPYPDEAAQQPIDKHESQAHHNGELVASTADPKFVSTANDTRGAANLSIIPSAYMEDDLHFPAKRPRSECLSNLENHMEETIHVDVEENRQTSRDSALDYELLEASLRSRLVDRFGKKPPLNNAEESSVELAIAKVTGTEHNKSPTYVGTQSQEAEANFPTSTEGTMELEGEDADLAEKICGQSNSSNGLSVDNRDMTTDPEDSMSLFRESCMSYAILPSSAPQNAARQMKRVLPGFCKEALDHQSGRLTSDAASEAAISAPDMLQDHPKENTKVLSRTNAKDNDMLDCGIDPFWPFCMFELRGRCNDEECQWQHVERCTWRKSEHSKHAIASVSGRIPYGLFKHILPVPTYRIGSNLIRADLNLVQSVLASSIWQYWQRGFCASFPLPLSVQRVLPSDAPFLQAGDGSIADFDRNRLLFNFQRPDGRKSKIGQGSIDAEQLLEAALDLYCGKVNKPDRIKALLLLARAIEADPSTVILWVFYLHIYYQKDEGLGKDDMFSQAVQHNVYSYELWVMYINSRLRFDDRLDAYNDALSMLCQMTADTDKELKDKSTFILDIFLRMIYFLCMSGNVKKAISRIFGIMATPDYSGDKLLTDVVSCLTVYDKCIFWVSCIYVLIYRKLPEEIAGQLELQKDLPHELIWPAIELRVDDRGQLVELLKYAVDKMALDINEVMKNGDPSYLRLSHFLAVSHINCLAALEGFQCSADLLVKYMKDYPTCPEILLISARLDKKYDTCPDLRGFDELILNWPKEVQGIQYLWNQYFEHALADNIDLAKKLLTRWFEEYGKDGLLQSSAAVCVEVRKDKSEYPSLASPQELSSSSSRSEDQVFWFLNLSLYRMLQNNMQEAQVAVDEALKLARGKSYEHCLREHAAIHIWDKSSSSTDFHSQDIFSLVSGYLADRWNLPMRELLSRRFCQNVKKHRVRQLMDDTLGPASADSYLINSILEVCYGPALLPDIIEVKHLVEFVESVMEVLPANYHLALAVGRFVVGHYAGADPASKGLRFWASSVLVNAIFRAVPVAPESVWLEGAHLLDKLQAMEIMNRFHQQATSVYPFSFRLWHAYLIAGKVTGSNTKSIVEAARQRGIELNPTPP